MYAIRSYYVPGDLSQRILLLDSIQHHGALAFPPSYNFV